MRICGVETGYVVKVLSPLLITALFFGGIEFVDGIINKTPLQPDWISNFFLTLFELLFVGLFEEVAFRALLSRLHRRQNTAKELRCTCKRGIRKSTGSRSFRFLRMPLHNSAEILFC